MSAVESPRVLDGRGWTRHPSRWGIQIYRPAPEPADLEIAVDCPFCEAPAGKPCTARRSSNRAPFTHRQRLQVASTLSPTKEATR